MGPELRTQLSALTAEDVEYSIGWLLLILSSATALWRKRNVHGQSTNVKPTETNKAKQTAAEGQIDSTGKQASATGMANPANCACDRTPRSINFALGSESLSHTDFQLAGPFPIDWTRTYYSRLSAYDQGAWARAGSPNSPPALTCTTRGLVFHDSDGREHKYALKPVGQAHYDAIENLTLVRVTENSLLLCRGFERRGSLRSSRRPLPARANRTAQRRGRHAAPRIPSR